MNTRTAAVIDEPRQAGLVSVDGKTFSLLSARLEGRAEGGVACSTLSQTYRNPYPEPLEVLYTLALPAAGAVVAYRVRIGDKVIEGEVRPREEAEKEYRDAITSGRTASLLAQDRPNTFSQRLGALPAGAEAEVEVIVLQPLEFVRAEGDGRAEWEYRFPTVVGVRYEGEPGRVPDREQLDVDRADGEGTPVRLELGLLVADGAAAEIEPNSPSHEIEVQGAGGEARVALGRETPLDRDVVIRWRAAAPEVGVRLTEGRGLEGDDGRYGLVTITPPQAVDRAFARDVIFLIDASGSMSGFPIEQVKRIVAATLETLDAGDRFEILAFANDVRPLVDRPTEATKANVDAALQALRQLQADGATEMTRAVQRALKPLREGSQRQVILLTDGYIGFEGEVVAEVARTLPASSRLHVVGVGSAPNQSLTRAAARAGRGVEVLITNEEDARAASRRLRAATARPVLTEIAVRGSAVKTVANSRPPDVLAGQPLVLGVELRPLGGTLEVRGNLAGEGEAWVRAIEVAPAARVAGAGGTDGGRVAAGGSTAEAGVSRAAAAGGVGAAITTIPIGALFGREMVEEAEVQLAGRPEKVESEKIKKEIERLGLRHRIVTRFTSMVAFALEPSVDPKAPRRRERLPLEIPAGVSAEGVGLFASTLTVAGGPMPLVVEEAKLAARQRPLPADRDERFGESAWFSLTTASRRIRDELAAGIEIHEVQVLRLEDRRLVIEFPVPVDGFLLPREGESVDVRFADGARDRARVLGRDSSPAGPHARGLVIRLALRLEGDHCWHHPQPVLVWEGHVVVPALPEQFLLPLSDEERTALLSRLLADWEDLRRNGPTEVVTTTVAVRVGR